MLNTQQNKDRFPLGHQITLEALDQFPEKIYAQLREQEPVSWLPCFNGWVLTRYKDIVETLQDSERFTVEDPQSLLTQTFGKQILSIDGRNHKFQRLPLNPHFNPRQLRESMTGSIEKRADILLSGLATEKSTELRANFASRYPVQNILDFFGVPDDLESSMRQWYDNFEKALSNLDHDPNIEKAAAESTQQFLDMFESLLKEKDVNPFLTALRSTKSNTTEDICRNALTIFFGGISTVEALILNTTWVLCSNQELCKQVKKDPSLIAPLLEETMRWFSPVQSSVRLVTEDTVIDGVNISKGERVFCMLAAANRDPEIWENPDEFDIERKNLSKHVGFSSGSHFCLGSHLARLEATIAIRKMLEKLPNFKFKNGSPPKVSGYEFRQPRSLSLSWD